MATPDEATEKQPVAPVELTADLPCPVLGPFGNDDANPSPEHVDTLEATLVEHGKTRDVRRTGSGTR